MKFNEEEKKAFECLMPFYKEIDNYYYVGDLNAVHKETGAVFNLHDCDGIEFEDVFLMYIHHYCYVNGLPTSHAWLK